MIDEGENLPTEPVLGNGEENRKISSEIEGVMMKRLAPLSVS